MSNKRLECARTKKTWQNAELSWLHNVLSPFLAEVSEAICLRCGALDLTQTNIKGDESVLTAALPNDRQWEQEPRKNCFCIIKIVCVLTLEW